MTTYIYIDSISKDGTYDVLMGMQKQHKIFYSLRMNHSSPFRAGAENGKLSRDYTYDVLMGMQKQQKIFFLLE